MNRIRWIVRQIQFLVWRVKNRLFPPTPWDGHHHPALLRIKPWKGEVSGDYAVDFLGVRTDPKFRSFFKPSPEGLLQTEYPAPDQTYFECIALLDSIAGAPGPEYTIVELGAGYGYWLVRTAKALTSRPDLSPRLVGVEMEATRYRWMREHFRNNGLDPKAHRLLQAAVSDRAGNVSYQAEEQEGDDYGLSLGRASPSGRAVEVPCIRLGPLLESYDRIDLLHMDIQGEELRVMRDERYGIRDKVDCLIIGTHSASIHRGIGALLQEDGWRLRFDVSGKSSHQTEYGEILFTDGLLVADRSDA